eukprot:m.229643 g.229643  ORF g.229643 m.229643 type:complete len:963 (-) comp11932_c0_seq1:191-3079(-)
MENLDEYGQLFAPGVPTNQTWDESQRMFLESGASQQLLPLGGFPSANTASTSPLSNVPSTPNLLSPGESLRPHGQSSLSNPAPAPTAATAVATAAAAAAAAAAPMINEDDPEQSDAASERGDSSARKRSLSMVENPFKEHRGEIEAVPDDAHLCSLWLESADEMQCRFAVKHDMRETNQKTPFVQANGYIEYKARYSKKRGQNTGYGSFHISFLQANRVLFPFYRTSGGAKLQREGSKLLSEGDLCIEEIERLDIYVRLYQSFRGSFPVRLISFGDDEVYHPMFIKSWQEPTLLQSKASQDMYPGLIARPEPNGECLRYTVQDPGALAQLLTPEGLRFPCPIPSHPERLNDVGMLRMQVSVRFYLANSRSTDAHHRVRRLHNTDEFDVWIKMKVVQQLSGEKLRFASMVRSDPSTFSLPPRPTFIPPSVPPAAVARYVLGNHPFRSTSGVELLQSLSEVVVKQSPFSVHTMPSIHAAAACGNNGVVRLLLQTDISLVHLKTNSGKTPLHFAAENGNMLGCKILLECGALLMSPDDMTLLPSQLAQLHGHTGVMQYLADLQAKEDAGNFSLFRGAALGRASNLARCIASGADVNDIGTEGFSPLWLAVLHNHPLCVHALMKAGANLRARNFKGETLLHTAAKCGFVEVVVLIAHHDPGAVNLSAPDGGTPLHRAAFSGQVLCANVMMSCGADISARNSQGLTPADVATLHGHSGTHLTLLSDTAPAPLLSVSETGGSLHTAARAGDLLLTKKLLAQGYSVIEPDANGETPLKLACKFGHVLVLDELISNFLAKGVPPPQQIVAANQPGPDGDTPLLSAISRGCVGCTLVMLSSGVADVNAIALFGGDTPVHRAAALGLPIITAFLLLHGAASSTLDASGRTPLDLATLHGHEATVQVLQSSSTDLFSLAQSLGSPSKSAPASPPRDDEQRFNLDTLTEVLRSIWHSAHHIRSVAAKCRTIPIA